MATIIRPQSAAIRWPIAAWPPLLVLPVIAVVLTTAQPGWVQMWALAFAIFAGFKWLAFATSDDARSASLSQSAGYLFLWTGMDADAFFSSEAKPAKPRWTEWVWAAAQTILGFSMLISFAPPLIESLPIVAAWLAMTGVVSILHFGVSQLLSLSWRSAGVNARHIMHKPVLATSPADFWGHRWNLAFRDLMHKLVFQPLVQTIGVAWATMAVFFVSGLVHDAVISLTARGGWGLPTLYFLIQGFAVLVQRSHFGKRLRLGRGIIGRVFAAIVVVAPASLLFHPPFLRNIVMPMLQAIHSVLP